MSLDHPRRGKGESEIAGVNKTGQWYKNYYERKGNSRNDLLENSGVLFQLLATDASVFRALRSIVHEQSSARVLDVGCGNGADLVRLFHVGYRPENITAIDILPDRIREAKELYPSVNFVVGDASNLNFDSNAFHLVVESTMFVTLLDEQVRTQIALEMIRVCKPGGYILCCDWKVDKPGDRNYKALTRKELMKLFCVNERTVISTIVPGALVPPVGRFLSSHLSALYFVFAACFPLLVGQVAYVLRKKEEQFR